MSELNQIIPLLRHSDTAERRKAIEALGKLKHEDALKYLAWVFKNEPDAELKALALETGKRLKQELSNPAPKVDEFVVDESLFEGELPAQAFQALSPNKTTIPLSDFEAKERRVRATSSARSYDVIDNLLGLALMFSFFCSLFFAEWLDLSGLRLASGGTYGNLIEEQKQAIWGMDNGQADYYKAIGDINVTFDSFEVTNLISDNNYTPFTVIYYDEPLVEENLQSLGYDVPNEALNFDDERSLLILRMPMIGYLILLVTGGSIGLANFPFDGMIRYRIITAPLRFLAWLVPARILYWISLLTVLFIFGSLWIWYSVSALPFVEAVLANQHIQAAPYTLVNVTSLKFWFYLIYLIALIGVCLMGIMRHSPKAPEPTAPTASKAKR